MHFAVGDADKRGNVAVQVQQRVQFHRPLVPAKLRPGKQRETEVDGGGIEGIQTVVQIHAHPILRIQRSGSVNQLVREIGEDAPVVSLIGVCQCRARDPASEPHAVEFAAHRSQAGFDVTETFAVSELSEGHREILIPARQLSMMAIAIIAGDALLELDVGEISE